MQHRRYWRQPLTWLRQTEEAEEEAEEEEEEEEEGQSCEEGLHTGRVSC